MVYFWLVVNKVKYKNNIQHEKYNIKSIKLINKNIKIIYKKIKTKK